MFCMFYKKNLFVTKRRVLWLVTHTWAVNKDARFLWSWCCSYGDSDHWNTTHPLHNTPLEHNTPFTQHTLYTSHHWNTSHPLHITPFTHHTLYTTHPLHITPLEHNTPFTSYYSDSLCAKLAITQIPRGNLRFLGGPPASYRQMVHHFATCFKEMFFLNNLYLIYFHHPFTFV